MRVGIVSDTHDRMPVVNEAVSLFDRADVDAVVHCGDFVGTFAARPFDGPWEFYAVRGNNDGEWQVQSVVDSFGTYLGEMAELQLDNSDIAVYHGTSPPIVDALVECGQYDFVFHGHSHSQRINRRRGKTVQINPCGVRIDPDDPGAAGGIVDLSTGDVTFHELE